MHPRVLLAFLGLAVTATVGTTTVDEIKIINTRFVGSGCPKHPIVDLTSDDRIELSLAPFSIAVGSKSSKLKDQVECLVEFEISHPANRQVRLHDTTVVGAISADGDVSAQLSVTTNLGKDKADYTRSISNSKDKKVKLFFSEYLRPEEQGRAAGCGETKTRLVLDTSLHLSTKNAHIGGKLSLEEVNNRVDFTHELNLAWTDC
ncbi:unnamed protein product [Parascedosporium putredinis]|uniref:DUF4360 domain-containing protein n=1 Tax=Parascedosporium putredinis TaxID=1442378 RepID=A0A9P1GZX7_9PEZI|nr:unnamed protein product [Parascedosporium putredinis]CAI7993383.1 unnamed protein product [Parascedosporium putredinis]